MPHRAYAHNHQKRRAYLLPRAYGQPCPLCGVTMQRTEALDLDHSDPASKQWGAPGDRIVHAVCNRGRANSRSVGLDTTREW